MQSQVQKAFRLIEKNKRDEAAGIFEEISSIEAEDKEDIVWRGRLAMELGENVFALQSFTMAVQHQPDNIDYIYLLACAYANVGNLTTAAEVCQKAVDLNPDRYEPYYILGKEAESKGQFSEAAEFYERSIQLKPSDTNPYAGLILSLRVLDRHEEALNYGTILLREMEELYLADDYWAYVIEFGFDPFFFRHFNHPVYRFAVVLRDNRCCVYFNSRFKQSCM